MMPNIMGNITITINFSYLQFEIYNEKSDKANAYLNFPGNNLLLGYLVKRLEKDRLIVLIR